MDVTLDTGALIAMERGKSRVTGLFRAAREHRARLLTITPVVAEWWRGRTDVRDLIRRAVTIVPFPLDAAETAGLVLGRHPANRARGEHIVDVMVMAFAATRGGALVYTSDVEDLVRLTGYFPGVRVLGV